MSDSSDEDYYGPALPPKRNETPTKSRDIGGSVKDRSSKGSREHKTDKSSKIASSPAKRVIGPTMPEDFPKYCQNDNAPAQSDDQETDNKEAVVKDARHDWMAGMNERLELSLEHVSEKDLQRKLKREGGKKNEKKPVIETRPIEEKEHHFVEDRGPSLMEIHQRMRLEKRMSSKRATSGSSHHNNNGSSSSHNNEASESHHHHHSRRERKEFNPEEDLKIPRFDSKRSREMLKEAKKVQDRFGDPRWL